MYYGAECIFGRLEADEEVAVKVREANGLSVVVKLCGKFCGKCERPKKCVVMRKLRRIYVLMIGEELAELEAGKAARAGDRAEAVLPSKLKASMEKFPAQPASVISIEKYRSAR